MNEEILDKKIDKCHFCHHLMTSSWKPCVDVNFRKSHKIIDQFDKSIKSYIKMFDAAGLLGPSAQVGLIKF